MPYRHQPPQTYRQSRSGGLAVVEQLEKLSLLIPAPVTEAAQLHDALRQRLGTLPSDRELRDRTLDALLADPSANVAKHVSTETDADVTRNALRQAVDQARAQLDATVTQHADDLLGSVRDVIFSPAVATLTTAAASTYTTATAALQADDIDAARALADVPTAAEQVALAYQLRRSLYRGSDLDEMACAVWRNPDSFDRDALAGLDGAPRWLAGIGAGAELWFGSYSEVASASREIEATRELKAQVDAHADARRSRRSPAPSAA